MQQWKRISGGKPFLLKGIQNVEDAKRSVELGCDGIVVRWVFTNRGLDCAGEWYVNEGASLSLLLISATTPVAKWMAPLEVSTYWEK